MLALSGILELLGKRGLELIRERGVELGLVTELGVVDYLSTRGVGHPTQLLDVHGALFPPLFVLLVSLLECFKELFPIETLSFSLRRSM